MKSLLILQLNPSNFRTISWNCQIYRDSTGMYYPGEVLCDPFSCDRNHNLEAELFILGNLMICTVKDLLLD